MADDKILIEVFGTGCAKCKKLEANAKKAVEELNINAKIVKVDDILDIAERGVTKTPSLGINGVIKFKGKLATVDEIKAMLKA
ncbi:MAG: thioredoxin family protein [Promethearchaeota archaeon]